MHQEVAAFVAWLSGHHPGHFVESDALEFGARDINGNVRFLFVRSRSFVGVDCVAGPNVDVVCLAHEYRPTPPEKTFDVAFCTEMLEHDPFWATTLATMETLTRPGGLLFFTCATTGRGEHGTAARPYHTGQHDGPDAGYYHNLTANEIACILLPGHFAEYHIELSKSGPAGLYFYAVKKE